MRAVVQRVTQASVEVEGEIVGKIGGGILILLGVEKGDGAQEANWLAGKVAGLRIFEDADGKMNLSLEETGGAVLSVSQFTLAGNCAKGRRPSFDTAAPPEEANFLYEAFNGVLRGRGLRVETGIFQADMKVALVNDGPVTFIVETPRRDG